MRGNGQQIAVAVRQRRGRGQLGLLPQRGQPRQLGTDHSGGRAVRPVHAQHLAGAVGGLDPEGGVEPAGNRASRTGEIGYRRRTARTSGRIRRV